MPWPTRTDGLYGARPSRPKTDYERRKQLRLDFFSPLDGPSDDRERLSALEIRAPSRGTAARATERKIALPLSNRYYEQFFCLTTFQLKRFAPIQGHYYKIATPYF